MPDCDCRSDSRYAPDPVSVVSDGVVIDTYVLDDARVGDEKVRVAHSLDGKPGWVDQHLVHHVDCDAAFNGLQVRRCARCSWPFRVSSEIHACDRCCALWIASEFFAATSGWEACDDGWFVKRETEPITADVIREILDARKRGDLLRELRFRLQLWKLPSGFDTRQPHLFVTEPLVDFRGGQWGTVADLIARPFNGYSGERCLVTRSRNTAKWRVASRPIRSTANLGAYTLVSAWAEHGDRMLYVVGDAKHRVADKVTDRQVASEFREFMRERK